MLTPTSLPRNSNRLWHLYIQILNKSISSNTTFLLASHLYGSKLLRSCLRLIKMASNLPPPPFRADPRYNLSNSARVYSARPPVPHPDADEEAVEEFLRLFLASSHSVPPNHQLVEDLLQWFSGNGRKLYSTPQSMLEYLFDEMIGNDLHLTLSYSKYGWVSLIFSNLKMRKATKSCEEWSVD